MTSRRTWISIIVLILLGMLLGMFGCAASEGTLTSTPTTTPTPSPITLKYATGLLESSGVVKQHVYYLNLIEQRSSGKVKFERYFAGSLAPSTRTLSMVGTGAIDLAEVMPVYTPGEMPLHEIIDTPFVFRSIEEALLVPNRLNLSIPESKSILDVELGQHNIKLLAWCVVPSMAILTTKYVDELEDLKGLKIRSFGEFLPLVWKKFGILPVDVPSVEFYESLQKGVIDGLVTSVEIGISYKLNELGTYVSFFVPNLGSAPICINQDTWQKLPPDVQNLMREVVPEYEDYAIRESIKAQDASLKLYKEVISVNTQHQDEFYKAFEENLEVAQAKLEAKGLGNEAKALIKIWLAECAKFR